MRIAIDVDLLPPGRSVAERSAAAKAYGYQSLFLTLAKQTRFAPDADAQACREWAREAADAGATFAVLTSSGFWEANYSAADGATRTAAIDATRTLIEQAAALGAEVVLVMPGVVGAPARGVGHVRYADALARTLEALEQLRSEAEAAGVTLAIENADNRFLLSPLEASELLAQANSARIGWGLNIEPLLAYGDPSDWVETLGGRVAHVRFGSELLQPSGLDLTALAIALQNVRFDGVVSFAGAGDPAAALRAVRPVLQAEAPAS